MLRFISSRTHLIKKADDITKPLHLLFW